MSTTTLKLGPDAACRGTAQVIPVVLLAYPILLLSVRNGISVCFVLLLVIALYRLASCEGNAAFSWNREDALYAAAMTLPIPAILVSQAYHQDFHLSSFDSASRFLAAIPIYLMLRHAPVRSAGALEYAFPLGALVALVVTVNFPSPIWRTGTYFVDSIHFGGTTLIVAFLTLGSINWTRIDPPLVLALKLAGALAGLYCALRSGARGAWLAIPVLMIVLAHYRLPKRRGAKYLAAGAALLIAAAGYLLVPGVPERVQALQAEIVGMLQGDLESSPGVRWQIWTSALQIFQENPIAGTGPEGLPGALRAMHEGGHISALALELGIAEVHNEILAHAVKLGLLGLIAILAIYIVPLVLFMGTVSASDPVKRTAALLGILFVVGHFVFGLTVETFNLKMFATFYALTVAALLAIARHAEPQAASTAP